MLDVELFPSAAVPGSGAGGDGTGGTGGSGTGGTQTAGGGTGTDSSGDEQGIIDDATTMPQEVMAEAGDLTPDQLRRLLRIKCSRQPTAEACQAGNY